jgi:Ca2+-binding EF-hand superfamily protein
VRLTPLRLALLFGAAVFLLGPTTALTWPGGKRLKGGDPNGGLQPPGGDLGSGGRGPADIASRMFDRYAKGKDVIIIAEMKPKWDPAIREKAQAYAQAKGITNGQLTRDQFADFMREQTAQEQSGGPPGGGGDPGRDLDADAEHSFRRHDKNNDGVLTPDEMPRALRDELEKWDKDKSGTIDLAEYKEYYKARMRYLRPDRLRGGSNDPNGRDGTAQPDNTGGEDKRPTVYKYGNLPKELPAWFAQLDTDKDGQVGLYEWKKAGGDIRKFMEMDRNGDGFLTVEEVLRYQKMVAAARKAGQAAGAAVDEQGNPMKEDDPTSPTTPMFTFRPPGGRQLGGH